MSLSTAIEHSHHRMVEGRDVPWMLQRWVESSPDKPFLIWEPFDRPVRQWTYGELNRDVEAMAGGLHEQGVGAGDFVIIHLENSPEFIISWFACARLGAVAVSTNTRSVARDISYFADHVDAVCAITQPAFATMIAAAAPGLKFISVTDNDAGQPAPAPDTPHIAFSSLLAARHRAPVRAPSPMDNLGVQFTSGTTSRPKAVLWTHANAVWGAQLNVAHMRLTTDDIAHVVLPLFHANAQSYSMLSTLWVGGTMVLQPKFSASRFWDVARAHKSTWMSIVLFGAKALLTSDPVRDHSFRFWGCSGNYPPIHEAFGIPTMSWWGMTETISHGIVSDVSHPGPPLCIGRASVGYDLRIVHADGRPIAPGESGRLFIRGVPGVSLFKEYYKNPEATNGAFDADGWFDTGDVIHMDDHGNLFFSDRDKDMLRVGAENVAASEIETVIMSTGWVSECAVVGQAHHMLDEVPVAFVVRNDAAPEDLRERLIDVCREKLADFKVVRDVITVDDMPRSTLDKISKVDLRKHLPPIDA